MGLPGDMSAAVTAGTSDRPVVTAPSGRGDAGSGGRIDTPIAVGNEGASTVVAAVSSASAQALLGEGEPADGVLAQSSYLKETLTFARYPFT